MKTCPTETPECPAGACGVRRRLCWRNLVASSPAGVPTLWPAAHLGPVEALAVWVLTVLRAIALGQNMSRYPPVLAA